MHGLPGQGLAGQGPPILDLPAPLHDGGQLWRGSGALPTLRHLTSGDECLSSLVTITEQCWLVSDPARAAVIVSTGYLAADE